jgi:hypothetical protein
MRSLLVTEHGGLTLGVNAGNLTSVYGGEAEMWGSRESAPGEGFQARREDIWGAAATEKLYGGAPGSGLLPSPSCGHEAVPARSLSA